MLSWLYLSLVGLAGCYLGWLVWDTRYRLECMTKDFAEAERWLCKYEEKIADLRAQLAAVKHSEEELESWVAQLRPQLAAAQKALAKRTGVGNGTGPENILMEQHVGEGGAS